MEKILNVARVYGINTISFNPMLLIPVVIVIIGAVAVFITLRKPESPKFRKINDNKSSSASNNNITKKKKRSTPLEPTHQTNNNNGKGLATKSETERKKKLECPVGVNKKSSAIDEKTQAKKSPAVPKNAKSVLPKDSKAKNKAEKKQEKDIQRFLNNPDNGDGEWQTVIGKKQKVKQTEETVSPAKVTKVKAKKENTNKNIKLQSTELSKHVEASEKNDNKPKVSNEVEEKKKENSTIVEQVSTTKNTESVDTESVDTALMKNISPTNVVFDELEGKQEDAGWMETKPAKKNKKRALRE